MIMTLDNFLKIITLYFSMESPELLHARDLIAIAAKLECETVPKIV
jgi:hypothetical protein